MFAVAQGRRVVARFRQHGSEESKVRSASGTGEGSERCPATSRFPRMRVRQGGHEGTSEASDSVSSDSGIGGSGTAQGKMRESLPQPQQSFYREDTITCRTVNHRAELFRYV